MYNYKTMTHLQLHRHIFIRRVETSESDYHSVENLFAISERAAMKMEERPIAHTNSEIRWHIMSRLIAYHNTLFKWHRIMPDVPEKRINAALPQPPPPNRPRLIHYFLSSFVTEKRKKLMQLCEVGHYNNTIALSF